MCPLLAPFLIRRTKATPWVNGKPLLVLPKMDEVVDIDYIPDVGSPEEDTLQKLV
jgi:hypothetical protein